MAPLEARRLIGDFPAPVTLVELARNFCMASTRRFWRAGGAPAGVSW